MNRREFIKNSALFCAGTALVPGYPLSAYAAQGPLVVMAEGKSAASLVRETVKALGGMEAFVKPGETVVVKPNIGWDRTPEQAANTHPEVVTEVIRLCLAAGAAKVKVFDRTCNEPRRCYVTSGIGPAVEAIGDPRVELSHIDDRRYRVVDIPGGVFLTRQPFYEDALTADKFINLPVAKHHGASLLTLGMKNIMGVAGGNRAGFHRNLPDALTDINLAIRSHLTIIDATRILLANGPQGGRLEDVKIANTLVAGTDIVAADSVAVSLFGKTPLDIPFLVTAGKRGLGVNDLEKIRVMRLKAGG
ncbi:DUF362 domain-containing protein [bacterium]|nr:MAG: DUF362 domain-containing protein [bacterium]